MIVLVYRVQNWFIYLSLQNWIKTELLIAQSTLMFILRLKKENTSCCCCFEHFNIVWQYLNDQRAAQTFPSVRCQCQTCAKIVSENVSLASSKKLWPLEGSGEVAGGVINRICNQYCFRPFLEAQLNECQLWCMLKLLCVFLVRMLLAWTNSVILTTQSKVTDGTRLLSEKAGIGHRICETRATVLCAHVSSTSSAARPPELTSGVGI